MQTQLRIFRDPQAHFWHDAKCADRVYTDEVLRRIADSGFNAVWVHVEFKDLLKHPAFPEFGQSSDTLLAGLNRVIERGDRLGMKVVVYCQEPAGPVAADPFWANHPEVAGAVSDHPRPVDSERVLLRSFCTGSEEGMAYLVDASESLLRCLPGLAGVVIITASEMASHCWSHYWTNLGQHNHGSPPCPRCAGRSPTDIVVGVLNGMREGMDRVSPETPLIAWNWSWVYYEEDPQPSILSRLDPRICVMGCFERGGTKVDATGRQIEIDEYSLCYAGPSERFRAIRDACRRRGTQVFAKFQLGTTHELATVSNLPLIGSLYEKATAFRRLDLAGYMGCWNFGNELSLNTRAFNFFLSSDCLSDRSAAFTALAEREFPGCDEAGVVKAWDGFRDAFDYYPFAKPWTGNHSINYSLAFPFEPGPMRGGQTGCNWQVVTQRGEEPLPAIFNTFTPEEVVERLGELWQRWKTALAGYEQALAGAGGHAGEELEAARAVYASMRSGWNFYRLHLLKRDWDKGMMPQFLDIVRDEIETLEYAIPVFERDPRQGFHAEAHAHLVTPALMRSKLEALQKQADGMAVPSC